MPARPPSQQEDDGDRLRVYRLPPGLLSQVRAKREKHNVNTQSVITAAATESLPKIVSTLKTMGLGFDGKKRPARLPMTDSLLGYFLDARLGKPAGQVSTGANRFDVQSVRSEEDGSVPVP